MKKRKSCMSVCKGVLALVLALILFVGDGSVVKVMAAAGDFRINTNYGSLRSESWYHAVLGTPSAWNNSYTGEGVDIAVLSTGCNATFAERHGVVGDISDAYGQGTAMCDLIGNKYDSQDWSIGIAYNANLYAYSVKRNATWDSNTADLAVNIRRAADDNMNIICIGAGNYTKSDVLEAAIDYAYERGCLIICAAGDQNSNTLGYPASYDHVVAVASLNESLNKTTFSNYGKKIRYCAPGVGFTVYDKNMERVICDESDSTSYAAAIVAGQAALLWERAEGSGTKKVENLLKLMDKSAVRYGSDMGKGMVSLQKALKLTVENKVPAKPTFSHKNGTYGQGFGLEIYDGGEMDTNIYYSTNGKPIVIKNGVCTSENAKRYYKPIQIEDNSRTTIYAVAYNNKTGLGSANVKVTYTIKPTGYASKVSIVAKENPAYYNLLPGKKLTMVAEPYPAGTKLKSSKVDWTIKPMGKIEGYEEGMVTISPTGVISARKDAVKGTFLVKATIWNGYSITANVYVVNEENPITRIVLDKTNISLLSDGKESGEITGKVYLADKSVRPLEHGDLFWVCENQDIVLKPNNNNYITGEEVGRVKMTGYTTDGSLLKITANVNVQQAVSSFWIDGNAVMAPGESKNYKAGFYPNNAVNKKVNWYIKEEGAKEAGITVTSSGRVSVSKDCKWSEFTLCASLVRGEENSPASTTTKTVEIKQEKSSYLRIDRNSIDIQRTYVTYNLEMPEKIKVECDTDNWRVTSNNNLVEFERDGDTIRVGSRSKYGSNNMIFSACGTSILTIETTDGSNKKVTCRINIKNYTTGLMIAPTGGRGEYVSGNSSLQLKPYYVTEVGPVKAGDKKVTWTSSNPDVKVSANGKVTLNTKTPSYPVESTITASCPGCDEACYSVIFVEPTKKLTLNSDSFKEGSLNVGGSESYDILINDAYDGERGKALQISVNKEGLFVQKIAGGKQLKVTADKPGTYKLTLKAMDGSNVKKTYTFKVTE